MMGLDQFWNNVLSIFSYNNANDGSGPMLRELEVDRRGLTRLTEYIGGYRANQHDSSPSGSS